MVSNLIKKKQNENIIYNNNNKVKEKHRLFLTKIKKRIKTRIMIYICLSSKQKK